MTLHPIDRLLGWPAWCVSPSNDNARGARTWIDAVRAWIVDPLARAGVRALELEEPCGGRP